ncbi:methyltransferase domain-containing protein [Novosphingobium rhizosphaerae]|uniref:methyltransferase domain-containing protein n=1 Tax=Novosphingobium rhizosphaerae TaxID=1551649 RepID=UPI0017AD108F
MAQSASPSQPTNPAPPVIFAPQRRLAQRARMRRLAQRPDAAHFLADDMIEDMLDRLSFLRHSPKTALVIGDVRGALATALVAQGVAVTRADPAPLPGETGVEQEAPLPFAQGFDLIAVLGTLDTVNDLPGALVHLRRALAPDGLAMMSFTAAGSLPALRGVMLAADAERPAPRVHPQVDVRAGGQLLQRAGFADPVIDSRSLAVRYRSLKRLVQDLREQGLSNCLARPGAPLGKSALARAQQAFAEMADADGRVTETFEILTLSGWAKPLRAPKF